MAVAECAERGGDLAIAPARPGQVAAELAGCAPCGKARADEALESVGGGHSASFHSRAQIDAPTYQVKEAIFLLAPPGGFP